MFSDVASRPLSPPAPESARSRAAYRPDIDGLRTIAVVPVVLFHAGFPWISGGYVGVDIFFVISGYLITRILVGEIARGQFSLVGFYERRARRILPALFSVLLSCLVAGWILLLPEAFSDLGKSSVATLAFLSNFWFNYATSDYFGPGAEMMPLLHTWSLAVEEQFYIVFPVFLWLVLPQGRRLTIALCIGLSLLSLLWVSYLLPRAPAAAFYLPLGRVWELGIGCLLALGLIPDLRTLWLRETVAMAGLCAILFAIFFYDADTPFPGLTALLPCLGAAALIAAGGQGSSLAARLLSLRPFVWIGLISYSLYLWHWPVFVFTKHYFGDAEMTVPVALAATALAFVLGWLSWAYVERPFRSKPPAGFSRRTIFLFSGTGIAIIAVLALLVFRAGGLPSRFGPEIRATIAAAADRNPQRATCFGRPPSAGLCRFGASSSETDPVTVLLWGDSHADAVMPGLAAAAKQAGVTGMFAGVNGCAPLLGVNRTDLGRTTSCSTFNAAVLNLLESRHDIPVVVLMSRWALTAEGVRPALEHGRPALLAADGGPAPKGPENNFAVFAASLRETVAAIRATGREVVLLGGLPEIGWNVPDRTAVQQLWGHALPPRPTATSVAAREARVDAAFTALAAADSGVRYVPLAPVLCQPECRTDLDGRLIYYDDDHVNAFGARAFLTPIFSSLF